MQYSLKIIEIYYNICAVIGAITIFEGIRAIVFGILIGRERAHQQVREIKGLRDFFLLDIKFLILGTRLNSSIKSWLRR